MFHLEADPHELGNLAGRPEQPRYWQDFAQRFAALWDLADLRRGGAEEPAAPRLIYEALRKGITRLGFEPHENAARRYMRNDMDLNIVESSQRYTRAD